MNPPDHSPAELVAAYLQAVEAKDRPAAAKLGGLIAESKEASAMLRTLLKKATP